MRSGSLSTLVLGTPLLSVTDATIYGLTKSTTGAGFFQDFNFQAILDPTHGRVQYVNASTAVQDGLAWVSPDGLQFFMAADSQNVVQPGETGRKSVRISSKDAYEDSVLVLDLQHMPEGCGTWPAFWTVTRQNWPYGGEIDIIEGINTQSANIASLHTSPGCTATTGGENMTGIPGYQNCDASVNNNCGCNVQFRKPNSYGADFNDAGGGWFAMERNSNFGIKMWFWSRDEWANVPLDVRNSGVVVNPSLWGTPEAVFSAKGCDIASYFDLHEIVFDLTFCGDYASAEYGADGCPGVCTDLVDNYPEAFKEAYWAINGLRAYHPV